VLASSITAGIGLNRHVDERVDHDVVALRFGEGLVVSSAANRVVTVRDNDQHLAAIPGLQVLGGQQDG
jgi:hypothetical protein